MYLLLQENGLFDPSRNMLTQLNQQQQLQQQQQQHLQQQQNMQHHTAGTAKPATGTISGMLADFSRALGK